MSHHVVSEVYKRKVGKMPRVPLLALMADKASDDGRGIWASKQTLADELGCSKQTVITTVDNLIADGLLIVVGDRACSNGHTVEYRIDIDALEALPLVGCHERKRSKKLTGQKSVPVKNLDPTSQKSGPDQSKVLTQTTLEPSLNPSPPAPEGEERVKRPFPISIDWVCPLIAALPPEIGALAAQWPAGAYQAEGAAFAQYWRGNGRRRADWDAQWAARVQARHAAVMRDAKAGVVFGKTPGAGGGAAAAAGQPVGEPVKAKRREDARSAELHALLEATLDPGDYKCWLAQSALVFEDCGLIVVAASRFTAAEIEKRHSRDIETALGTLGRGVDWTRFVAEGAPDGKGKRRG